jgi:RNA polymerase sigma-70 factor, ECF subfamily
MRVRSRVETMADVAKSRGCVTSNSPAPGIGDRNGMMALSSAAVRAPGPAWALLANRVRRGDQDAMQELYGVFSKGIRFMLFRQLGPEDLDDKVHDVFVMVAQSLRRGELRDPTRLMGYIHTVVRRQIAGYIERAVTQRRTRTDLESDEAICDLHPSPENEAIERANREFAMRVLRGIPKRDREVLIRFYLKEQRPAQICRALKITRNQFRLIKCRAKARFTALGQSCLAAKAPAVSRTR